MAGEALTAYLNMTIRKINWEKRLPDNSSQRRFVGYNFKENNVEIGFLQIKGLLNREVKGKLFDNEIEYKDRYSPESKWYSPKIHTVLFDNKTKQYLAKITGSLSINYLKQTIYKREIVTSEGEKYTFQIQKNQGITLIEENTETNIINCDNPTCQKGEIIYQEGINLTVLLAVFYILHQFMELSESS